MPDRLTSIIELVVGLVCLAAGWGTWRTLRSVAATMLFVVAGAAAAGHAVWMLAGG